MASGQLRHCLVVFHGMNWRFIGFEADALAVVGDAGPCGVSGAGNGQQQQSGDVSFIILHSEGALIVVRTD